MVEEQKQLCFTCLKEYFVPAHYCDEIGDYMARAIIKYPTVVVGTSDDDGHFIGRYDAAFTKIAGGDKANECNNDENLKKDIDLALICRIMPNFLYQNQEVCKTKCSSGDMTEDQLNDLTDFRPNNKDCGKQTLPIGGKLNAYNIVNDGALLSLGKCCAASWQLNKDNYAACSGESTQQKTCTYAVPVDQEPWCYCDEGGRPLGETRNGDPSRGSGPAKGGDCADFTFISSNPMVYGYTNAVPAKDTVYVATDSCNEQHPEDNSDDPIKSSNEVTTPKNIIWQQNVPPLISHVNINLGSNIDKYIHAGVYHRQDANGGSTGWVICAQCSETDENYPFYNTQYDQCSNKL